jgi:hypothetical protein
MTRTVAIASRMALAILLAATFLRALVAFEPFPYWSGDPTLINIPASALGPAAAVLLDAVSLLAAGVMLFSEPLLGRRIQWLALGLACLGCIGIAIHAWGSGPTVENLRIGAVWASALLGAVAIAHAARDAHTARLIAASALGLIAMLAAKGFIQVFVEHADNIAMFNENRSAFLAAQGWSPGSAAALSFERRLTQPEATTWFGLSNVTASFAAASLTVLTGWTILAWRETRTPEQRLPSGWSGVLTIGALCALGVVILAGGKGGYTAALLGLLLLAAARLGATAGPAVRRAMHSLAPALPLVLIAAALLALALRGLMGERMGELSLLFRWYYISTAARIFAEHPIMGIGPAGFQDAYQLLKPALSPEEVTSPHSVFFDFASTLGLFGIALGGVILLWVSRAGSILLRSPGTIAESSPSPSHRLTASPSHGASSRPDIWFLLFVTAMPTLLSAWVEVPIATPDSTIMRLLGLAAWFGIALSALSLMRLTEAWRIPFAAGAIVLAIHGQIEVTPVWPGSAALFFLILAAAAPTLASATTPASAWPRRLSLATLAAVPALLIASMLIARDVPRLARWEHHLATAADAFRDYTSLRARYDALSRGSIALPGDSPSRLMADLRDRLPTALRSEPPSPQKDLGALFRLAADEADIHLNAHAAALYPHHLPTLLAASRLCLQASTFAVDDNANTEPSWADRAEAAALRATIAAPTTAASWGWLGTLRAARYEMTRDRSHLEGAVAAWTRAASLDPHGLSMPMRLLKAHTELGNADQAHLWASRALEAHKNLHLDPLKQLSPAELAEVRRAAGQ